MHNNPPPLEGGRIDGSRIFFPRPFNPDNPTIKSLWATAGRAAKGAVDFLVEPQQVCYLIVTLTHARMTRMVRIVVHPGDSELAAANAARYLSEPLTDLSWNRETKCLVRVFSGDVTIVDEVDAGRRWRTVQMPREWRTGLPRRAPLPRTVEALSEVLKAAWGETVNVTIEYPGLGSDGRVVTASTHPPFEGAVTWHENLMSPIDGVYFRRLPGDAECEPVVMFDGPVDPFTLKVDERFEAARKLSSRPPVLAPGYPLRRKFKVELEFTGPIRGKVTWEATSQAADERGRGNELRTLVCTPLARLVDGGAEAARARLRLTGGSNDLVTTARFVKDGSTVTLHLDGPRTKVESWLGSLIQIGLPLDSWSVWRPTPPLFAAGLGAQYGGIGRVTVTSRFVPVANHS